MSNDMTDHKATDTLTKLTCIETERRNGEASKTSPHYNKEQASRTANEDQDVTETLPTLTRIETAKGNTEASKPTSREQDPNECRTGAMGKRRPTGRQV